MTLGVIEAGPHGLSVSEYHYAMQVVTGTVVEGKVISEGASLPEGTVVTMLENASADKQRAICRHPGVVLLRRRAADHDGEMTWISKLEIQFAFGTMATPRARRDFMPRPFPIHPLARCTSRRETFRPEEKEMC